ncbi:MAG: hypothetical protein OXC95_05960 [Dehalococcoidia bacterium]|nr:hypothetical protein [Dehalococcoidia bacterium]
MNPPTIRKVLSANDSGETGAHQAGILIPRDRRILSFFPALPESELNPRAHILFEDCAGHRWKFAFIYYNNRRFRGTRDEYRLTRMTRYIREAGLSSGDEIILHRDGQGDYSIEHRYAVNLSDALDAEPGFLRLSGGWRVINF